MKSIVFLALAALASANCLAAGPARGLPLRADHPLLGAWDITTDDSACVETWRIDRGGGILITSADEVAEAHFTLADQPSARGYYRLDYTLFRDNGKKDCSGQVTKPPRSTVDYILVNPAGNRFIVCSAEDGKRCFGPFVKVEGGEI